MICALMLMAAILFLAWAWDAEDNQERDAEAFLREKREQTKKLFREHDA